MYKLSRVCSHDDYHIGIIDGYGLVRNEGGYLSVDGLKTMIDALTNTVTILEEHNKDQAGLLGALEQREYKKLMSSLTKQDFTFYPKARRQLRGKGSGVYFVGDTGRPDIAKIGMSDNLANRTLTLGYMLVGKLEIYAVITTPDNKIYESALHRMFSDHQVTGEWFKKEPVLAYVNSLMAEWSK